jgi:DNA-directed RNA polymerase specialized sigma24 family protein
VLGIKEDTVSKRVSRAQTRLRLQFELLGQAPSSTKPREAS